MVCLLVAPKQLFLEVWSTNPLRIFRVEFPSLKPAHPSWIFSRLPFIPLTEGHIQNFSHFINYFRILCINFPLLSPLISRSCIFLSPSFLPSFQSPLSPTSVACVCMNVGPPTGARQLCWRKVTLHHGTYTLKIAQRFPRHELLSLTYIRTMFGKCKSRVLSNNFTPQFQEISAYILIQMFLKRTSVFNKSPYSETFTYEDTAINEILKSSISGP